MGLLIVGTEGILGWLVRSNRTLTGKPLDGGIGNRISVFLGCGTATQQENRNNQNGKKGEKLHWFHRVTVKDIGEKAI